jgi:hypothetical protein
LVDGIQAVSVTAIITILFVGGAFGKKRSEKNAA